MLIFASTHKQTHIHLSGSCVWKVAYIMATLYLCVNNPERGVAVAEGEEGDCLLLFSSFSTGWKKFAHIQKCI